MKNDDYLEFHIFVAHNRITSLGLGRGECLQSRMGCNRGEKMGWKARVIFSHSISSTNIEIFLKMVRNSPSLAFLSKQSSLDVLKQIEFHVLWIDKKVNCKWKSEFSL